MPTLPYCAESTYIGGCVDYQFRMAESPLTFAVPLVLLFADLKWKMPFFMMFPYVAGRLATAFATTMDMQVLVATPLLSIGYFWAHLSYSSHALRDAFLFLFLMVSVWLLVFVANRSGMLDRDLQMDLAQMVPFTVAVIFSWIALVRQRAWVWFVGLFWGMVGPIILTAIGVPPYDPVGTLAFSGPALFYSDSVVTMPCVFTGMLLECIRGPRARVQKLRKD